ncbi:MAG: hypothetical protein Q8P62_05175 [Candidatus Peregrinibacteria bacterium]|nr:hypothetical protein [Candidatus Peregrinibacteria bacterium]
MNTLTHITDVGAPYGEGTDSNERIRKQYNRLGVEPRIVNAGQSPLHVAFTACTDIIQHARENACQLLRKLGIESESLPPTALNSAPRNAVKRLPNGQEDHIFRVKHPDIDTLLLYGPEVLSWVLEFRGRTDVVLDRIVSLGDGGDIINNTSNGSQFRSSEHLPLAHFLESLGRLDEFSEREAVDPDGIVSIAHDHDSVFPLPPDEYGNGRLLAEKGLFDEILDKDYVRIPGLLNKRPIAVRQSLTDVEQTNRGDNPELAVWPSSNHFPGGRFGVLNIGARYGDGETKLRHDGVLLDLILKLRERLGNGFAVEFGYFDNDAIQRGAGVGRFC